jgi:hypothetical protein
MRKHHQQSSKEDELFENSLIKEQIIKV